ncbi:hypothetical protein BGZ98_003865 [Dissophora globulifera]|nr:hypothetical protein BGZ98_003865 [Dissophora globulifera]
MQRAISILEILERILSFLPQKCLCHVASLVCKDWLRLSRSLLTHQYQWTDIPGTLLVSIPAPPRTDQEMQARRRFHRASALWPWNIVRSFGRSSSLSTVSRFVHTIPELDTLTKRLENLTILRCRLIFRTAGFTASIPLGETHDTITQVMTTTMEELQNHARTDLLHAIEQLTTAKRMSLLELHIESLDDLNGFLQPMLRSTTMLTKLRLRNVRICRLPINMVLRQCQRLEDLYIDCEAHSSQRRLIVTLANEPLGSTGLSEDEHVSQADFDGTEHNVLASKQALKNGLPRRLALRRLHLKDVMILESTLLAILDSAPVLYELMIQSPPVSSTTISSVAMVEFLPLPTTTTATTATTTSVTAAAIISASTDSEAVAVPTEQTRFEDWVSCEDMEFIQEIGHQYPQLTSLHFTRAHHRYTNSQIRQLLKSFPRATRWSLAWRDLPDGILRDLNSCVESATPHEDSTTTTATINEAWICRPAPEIYRNYLTSLEIVPSADWTPRWGNALHDFLCSSPLLEHLRAGSIAYYIENLDLNGLLQERYNCLAPINDDDDDVNEDINYSCSQVAPSSTYHQSNSSPSFKTGGSLNRTSSSSSSSSGKVWACRNLKTLHLEFTRRRHIQHHNAPCSTHSTPASSISLASINFFGSSSNRPSNAVVLENSPLLSRIVYGYISRFCPHLQDLLIRGYRLNMTLKGGFCLLTRLRDLKWIAISQYDCQFKERDILPWVAKRKTTVTAVQRMQWRAIIAGWWRVIHSRELRGLFPAAISTATLTESTEQATLDSSRNANGRNNNAIGSNGFNNQDILKVGKLGSLQDVVDVLKDTAEPARPPRSGTAPEDEAMLLWEQSGHVWPNLECVRIVYGNGVKAKSREGSIRALIKKYRPEVEFQWVSWLEQYY